MANIEVSLSSATNLQLGRRRKGLSLGSDGSNISRTGQEVNSFGMMRRQKSTEEIIQSLRDQINTGTSLRSNSAILGETEIIEHDLRRLKNEADSKRTSIKNSKIALENLNITDNIDVRIKQAELEYALGREELQLLSLMEDIRTLQLRLEKCQKTDNTKKSSLYVQLQNGFNMILCAVNANLGRFGLNFEDDSNVWIVDWALDGELLFRGDRIIEYNGKFVESICKEDIRKLLSSRGKCNLVVIRKKTSQQNCQLILQSDNQRLQHRISFLEDQVKELQQTTKEKYVVSTHQQNSKLVPHQTSVKGDHVTSISILSSNPHDCEKPQIFQRGNFVATIIDGKAVQASSNVITTALTRTESPKRLNKSVISKSNLYSSSDMQRNGSHNQSSQPVGSNSKIFETVPKISIRNFCNTPQSFLKQRERNHEYFKENYRIRDVSDRHNSHPDLLYESNSEKGDDTTNNRKYNDQNDMYKRVESHHRYKRSSDIRSAKSLDFEEEVRMSTSTNSRPLHSTILCRKSAEVDYTSEPAANSTNTPRLRSSRPTPPKKPLRLSLQRTQSLQTIEANAAATIVDLERKRAIKRTHRGNRTPDLHH